ncbi:MAG: N-acetyl-gamma-glutamyl-phosphate reductase [bacterium]
MSSAVSAAVVGATGYGGAELVSLLHRHPSFTPEYLTSRSYIGEAFSSVYPRFKGSIDRPCEELDTSRLDEHDIVFFALPHGKSMEIVQDIDLSSTRVVDLAADYRLRSATEFETVYDTTHTDETNLEKATFGLTEYFKESIANSDLVACPGCYVTASLVPLYPLAEEGLLNEPIFIDAKSGVSGAGRSPSEANTFVNCNDNIRPYNVAQHRHAAEISQVLEDAGGTQEFSFVPHVNAMDHGIEAAIYLQATSPEQANRITAFLESTCSAHDALRYHDEPPGVKSVVKTPHCDISTVADDDRVIVFSTLDNLWKGAASQAIQNANVMFGRPNMDGLV